MGAQAGTEEARGASIDFNLGNERRGAVEQACVHISSLIDLHRVQPGGRLPSAAELAQQIGVSRPAVLQALKILSAQGRLIVRPGRGGTWVTETAATDHTARRAEAVAHRDRIIQMAHLREMVESGVARLVAERGMAADLMEEARQLVQTMKALPEGDDDSYHALNTEFHLLIARGSGMPVLESTVAMCRREVAAAFDLAEIPRDRRKESDREHVQLLDAIERRDSARAAKVAQAHVGTTTRLLEKVLGRRPASTRNRKESRS